MTATIPDSARLATPLMQRTLCPACRHYHREAMAKRCACCSEQPGEVRPGRRRAARAKKDKPAKEPVEQPVPVKLVPHYWVQPTGFGPSMYAGQVLRTDGRPARYRGDLSFHVCPVHLAPLTEAGLEQLAAVLQDDIRRAMRGAA